MVAPQNPAQSPELFVRWLRQVAPYVHAFRGRTFVIGFRGALDAGEVVLVAHVGYSPTGEVFNLAWEDVAENVAIALRADKLLMFTDRLPLDRKEQVISELTAYEAEALARKGAVTAQTS